MDKYLKLVLLMLVPAWIGSANASLIHFATGYSEAIPQTDAEAYRTAVEVAVAQTRAGYGSGPLARYDNVSNQAVFGGTSVNIAYRSIITFDVDADKAGVWRILAGVDFGGGGAVFLDGIPLGFKTNDMWWGGSYADQSQYFDFTLNLSAGSHQLSLYGLEPCCDGAQQVQFKLPNQTEFTSFANHDGLLPIPEPEPLALVGLGLAGLIARRRS